MEYNFIRARKKYVMRMKSMSWLTPSLIFLRKVVIHVARNIITIDKICTAIFLFNNLSEFCKIMILSCFHVGKMSKAIVIMKYADMGYVKLSLLYSLPLIIKVCLGMI